MRVRETPAEFLRSCFLAGVDAVRPERCLPPAIAAAGRPRGPCAVLTVGKAAPGMVGAIGASLAEHGAKLLPPLVIGIRPGSEGVRGNHPLPGDDSARAAAALGRWVRELPTEADVHIGLSGGTSALIGAPLPGINPDELRATFKWLLHSGLDIEEMNAVRKRLTRWSAGRLARALAPRRMFVWLISDVPGDDPATIASGPCHGDPWTSAAVERLLKARRLWNGLSPAVQAAIAIETPKPGAAGLGEVRWEIVARNADAVAASAEFARTAGIAVQVASRPLSGEARDAGYDIASRLRRAQHLPGSSNLLIDPALQAPDLWIYGGETVVTLPGKAGPGGRSQELALAAAEGLASPSSDGGMTLLAAGTDGRDGNTPAAGAVVDGSTWRRVIASGRDPTDDLARHTSHDALAAADTLLRTGHTGTNVMDVVLALSDKWSHLLPPEARRFDRSN